MTHIRLASFALFLLWLVLSLIGNTTLAAPATPADARQVYFDARSGTKDLNDAVAVIDNVLQTNTDLADLAIVLVYKGSLRAMQAGKTDLPWKKMRYMGEAIETIDKSMDQLLHSDGKTTNDVLLEALIISGITCASIPRSYGRAAVAKRYLATAIALAEFPRLPGKTKATVYAWLSVLNRDILPAESQHYLELARSLDRTSADEIGSK